MSLTIPKSSNVASELLGDRIVVEKVLYEAERAIVFTTRTKDNRLLLAYVADENADWTWYVLAPTTTTLIDHLESGAIAVRQALAQSWTWLAQEGRDGRVTGAWTVDLDTIDSRHLPAPETPLLPEHEAALVTRAIGPQLELGRIPASVIDWVTGASRKAVKTILDLVTNARQGGRPRDEQRGLYDLRVQRLAFASFQVSFAPPDEGLFDRETIVDVAAKLHAALTWAASDAPLPGPWTTPEEQDAMLSAALLLAPPSSGAIEEVVLTGKWLQRKPVLLNRASRRKVRAVQRPQPAERVVTWFGRVGEVDRDNFTLILRGTEGQDERRGSFAEELLDDVIQFLSDNRRVNVAGKETAGKLHVTAIAPVVEIA